MRIPRGKNPSVKDLGKRNPSFKEHVHEKMAYIGTGSAAALGYLNMFAKLAVYYHYPTELYNFVKGGSRPRLYSMINKDITDILFEDYSLHRFSISYKSFSSSVTINQEEQSIGDLSFKDSLRSLTCDLRFCSDNTFSVTATVNQVAPAFAHGLTFIANVNAFDNAEFQLRLQQRYACLSASLGLLGNTDANVSAVVGAKTLSIGSSVSVDTATRVFTEVRGFLSISTANELTTGSLNWNEFGDVLKASIYHEKDPNTVIGAELEHMFANGNNVVTVGAKHLLDSSTSIKAHVNSDGLFYGRLSHSVFTLAGIVSFIGDHDARIGLTVAIS